MKIQSLQLKDFKNFEDKLFLFGNQIKIEGRNGAGKSTIREAALFALYNKTDATARDTDKYIRNGAGFCEVTLKTDKGEVKRQRNNRKSEVFLNGEKTTQENIEDKLGLPRFEVFNSVFTAGYFMTLEEKEQRQIVLDLMPPVDRAKIFEELGGKLDDLEFFEASAEDLNDLDTLYKKVNATKKKLDTHADQEIYKADLIIKSVKDQKCVICGSKIGDSAIKKLEDDAAKMDGESKEFGEQIDKGNSLLKIIQKIPQEEIRLKLKDLEPLLAMTISEAEIVLMETLKSEMGYKPVFKLLVGGKEYKYLSTGEKKKVDVGICELINIFYRLDMVFIDNLESMSEALITNFKQIFMSRVTQDELTVTTQ